MTTQTYNTQQDVVKDLRKIREQFSSEIKDISFEEERAYLDKLLAEKISLRTTVVLLQVGLDVKTSAMCYYQQ
jgi:hypothetical protein